MVRNIDIYLRQWKAAERRNVLLVRGARQVGKTYSVRELGRSFKNLVEINFEERPETRAFFDGPLTPGPICEKLAGFTGVPIRPGETLLFFDEVQACPNCLRGLRFFKEKLPSLHVVAAGSLLEFALAGLASFGVGRITSIFMHPLTFGEFVRAVEGDALADMLAGLTCDRPVESPFHHRFLDLFRTYLIIGGLPEVVTRYVETRDFLSCQALLSSLIAAFEDDFAKYAQRTPSARLSETFRSAAIQAGRKFVYSAVSANFSHRESKTALELLEKASLVHRVTHTSAQGIPLGAQANTARFKVLVFDAGIHQRLLDLNLSDHLVANMASLVNRGSLAETAAGLQIVGSSPPLSRPSLYYWHREARASNAEVDYVLQHNGRIVPVEVKAGGKGAMKSMHLFLQEHKLPLGIRLSQENFSRCGAVMSMPLYAAGRLADSGFNLPV